MNTQLWLAVLAVISGALTLATKILPVTPELLPWLIYGSALIDLIVGTILGYTGIKTLRARSATHTGGNIKQ